MKPSSLRSGFKGSKIAPVEFDGIPVRVDDHLKKMGAVWK